MTKMPIVLADDEPYVRSLIKRILTSQGFFVVLEAQDGLDAFAIIQELNDKVSLLVTDVGMPRLDGASLCRKVKETFPSIPVLLMSGHPEPEASGSDAFLRKPSQFHLLPSVVSDLCNETTKVAQTTTTDL